MATDSTTRIRGMLIAGCFIGTPVNKCFVHLGSGNSIRALVGSQSRAANVSAIENVLVVSIDDKTGIQA